MLIETTQTFDNKEDAEDNLEGIKALPGFLYGYIRIPSTPAQKYDLIHVFDCNGDTQNLRKQRAIEHFTIAENTIVRNHPSVKRDIELGTELARRTLGHREELAELLVAVSLEAFRNV